MVALLKVMLVTVLAAVGMCGFGAVAIAGYLFSGGVASVEVDTPDVDLHLPVPLRVLDLGLGVAGLAAPDEDLIRVREDLEEWRPLLLDLADEIHHLPEGEIVRVETDTELVLIAHHGGRLSVEVEAPDAYVKVTAPRRAIGRIVDKAIGLAAP